MEKNIEQLRRELKTKFFRLKDEICYKNALEQCRITGEIERLRNEIFNLRAKAIRANDPIAEGDLNIATQDLYRLRREKVELDNKRKCEINDLNDEYSAQIAALEYDEKQSRQISAEEWQETASKTELISTYEKDGLKIEVSRVYPEPGDDIAYDISVSSLDSGLLQGSVYLNSIAELRLLYGAIRSFMETKDEHNG